MKRVQPSLDYPNIHHIIVQRFSDIAPAGGLSMSCDHTPVDRDLLDHLLAGSPAHECMPQIEERVRHGDFKALCRQVENVRWLAEQTAAINEIHERSRAQQELARMLNQNPGLETTRRICMAILHAPKARRPGPASHRQPAACAFLRQVLSAGPQPAAGILEMAGRAGIARATLQRAKNALCIVTTREGFGRHGRFFWRLPGSQPHPQARPDHDAIEGRAQS
jgi:hypothetical protein